MKIGLRASPGSAATEVAGFYTAMRRRQRLARVPIALTDLMSGAVDRPGNVAMKAQKQTVPAAGQCGWNRHEQHTLLFTQNTLVTLLQQRIYRMHVTAA